MFALKQFSTANVFKMKQGTWVALNSMGTISLPWLYRNPGTSISLSSREHALSWQTYTVFTLGQNMLSLIINETCFTMKIAHIRQYIAQIIIETCLFSAWLKLIFTAFTLAGNNPCLVWSWIKHVSLWKLFTSGGVLLESQLKHERLDSLSRRMNITASLSSIFRYKCNYKLGFYAQIVEPGVTSMF